MDDFWSPLQIIIEEICSDFDKVWQTRKRVIGTQFLVTFILKLVLSKNSQGYKILLNELWETAEFSEYSNNRYQLPPYVKPGRKCRRLYLFKLIKEY